ncbi:MAG: hypothetical protein JOZ43_06045 [Acidobacteriales bacterium]|nr:hypothetical protein [Terriglobales bacterium]
MKRVLAIFAVLICSLSAPSQQPSSHAVNLPTAFAGWVRTTGGASSADSALLPVLQEFRMLGETDARYLQNGNVLDLSVYAFPDRTGAYGAFTFFREGNMRPQKIGDDAVTGDNRVVFYRGNLLVDAHFQRVTAMTLSQLRELSNDLPVAPNAGNPPALPRYLPEENLAKSSVHYAVGPVGAKLAGVPVDPQQLDFDKSPEVVTAVYGTASAAETLSLLSYPTPQIAGDELRKLQGTVDANHMRRTHSILVLASGNAVPEDAKALVNFVNYDADLTWNEATKLSPKDNLYGLLFNIILLSAVLIGFTFVFGISLGGFRWMYYRMNPEKAAAREQSEQLIRLNL